MAHDPRQLTFGGYDRPARDRLFFAVVPDEGAARRTADIADRLRSLHGLKGRPLTIRRFHVSLHWLGDYDGVPRGIVTRAHDAASRISEKPFPLIFDRAATFSRLQGNHPLVLRNANAPTELATLHQKLLDAMNRAGLKAKGPKSLTPHMTLLYADQKIVAGPVEPVEWTVRDFVLIHSIVGESRYVRLGQWRLQD
jgi:2'-5' RNA ligase